MRRRKQSELDKGLADNAHLLRAWRRWHREQLEAALADVHRDVIKRLMLQLKHLHEARELLRFIEAQDWAAIDAETRLIALHEINVAITKLRERSGLEPIDDALPHERPNVFILVKEALFPRERKAPPDARNPVREQWRQ
jgi:hypothetical protein